MAIEYLNLTEARGYLGISKPTMWQLVKSGAITTFSDPTNKRVKLVRKDDLDRLRLPRMNTEYRGHKK